jgi:hypothetical protein
MNYGYLISTTVIVHEQIYDPSYTNEFSICSYTTDDFIIFMIEQFYE